MIGRKIEFEKLQEIIIKHSTLLRRNSAAAPVNIRKTSPQTINAIH